MHRPLAAYSASKAAAFSITQALRANLAKQRISVHGVFAGPIDTDPVREKTSPERVAKAIVDGVEPGPGRYLTRTILAGGARRDPKGLERQFARTMGRL